MKQVSEFRNRIGIDTIRAKLTKDERLWLLRNVAEIIHRERSVSPINLSDANGAAFDLESRLFGYAVFDANYRWGFEKGDLKGPDQPNKQEEYMRRAGVTHHNIPRKPAWWWADYFRSGYAPY